MPSFHDHRGADEAPCQPRLRAADRALPKIKPNACTLRAQYSVEGESHPTRAGYLPLIEVGEPVAESNVVHDQFRLRQHQLAAIASIGICISARHVPCRFVDAGEVPGLSCRAPVARPLSSAMSDRGSANHFS